MEENKLKVAPQSKVPELAAEKQEPTAFAVPVAVMNDIMRFIGQGSFAQVEPLVNLIRNSAQPLYANAKTKPDETENQTTSNQ